MKRGSPEPGASKTLGIYLASVLLLLATVLASSRAGREVAIGDFPMDLIPAKLGEWTWDRTGSRQQAATQDTEALRYSRTYRNPAGEAVSAELKVTSSRIGSMRDYGTVMIDRLPLDLEV